MRSSGLVHSLLLISPQTYNYHEILCNACVHEGIDFIWLDERPSSSVLFKVIARKFNKLARILSIGHYFDRLQEIKSSGFSPSHILVIKGESIDSSVIDYMRNIFPGARLVLYFWDSTKNLPGYRGLVQHFDLVASFDPIDCRLNNWCYWPLFCGNPAAAEESNTSIAKRLVYDWSFVGVVHSDLLSVLYGLVKSSRLVDNLFVYVYFPSLFHYLYFFVSNPLAFISLKKYFHSSPLSPNRLRSVYSQSRCIVDIHHPSQSGLTMRTIESVVSGVKLATTNQSISEDIFYDKTRIFIVDRNNPAISPSFLADLASPLSDSISNSFSPGPWLRSLLTMKLMDIN